MFVICLLLFVGGFWLLFFGVCAVARDDLPYADI